MDPKKLTAELEQKRQELALKMKDWTTESGEYKMTAEDVQEFNKRHDEINDLAQKSETANKVARVASENAKALEDLSRVERTIALPNGEPEAKSLGALFAGEVKGHNLAHDNFRASINVEDVKAVMTRAAGFAPQYLRTGRVAFSPQTPIRLAELIPWVQSGEGAVVYMQESTFTNSAAERAEAGAYAESALAYTQVTEPLQIIGTSLPVTDEQLRDVAQVQALIDNRLSFMVLSRLDSQILAGTGTDPQIRGLGAVTGINTQAKSTSTGFEQLFAGFQAIRKYGNEPSFFAINPSDWGFFRLKLSTTNGIFLLGSPVEAGPERIWGVPVAQSANVTAGTGYAADVTELELRVQDGVVVETGYNADDFTKGKKTVRAGIRVALVAYKPKSITKFTGIAADS